ncbi:spore germination protein [Brevibacillus dissolubilis]|uniref:spore germination protein n=1 Tax=Brevibacillus dissolubilis TaxID=1844116 RepID=UPI0011166BA3|nr:spore germination protein [Brevibacillus dissolubilis]
MNVWEWWRKKVVESSYQPDGDVTYPEAKGEISVEAIEAHFRNVDDLVIKNIVIIGETVTAVYIKTMVEPKVVQEIIVDPLLAMNEYDDPHEVLKLAEEIHHDELPQLLQGVLNGDMVLIFHTRQIILQLPTLSMPSRSIGSSETESTVLGPQDSFTESLDTTISLIRRRLYNTNLKVKIYMSGTETRNKVAVLYMEGIANPENVERAIYRVQNLEYHGFVALPVLKQMLEDKPYSPFPQFGMTTRPDNAVAALLDGRILIALNGSPEAAIVPSAFFELFCSPEDLYNRWLNGTMLRFIRFFGLFVTVLLTSTYVSVLTYHPEMLPPQLLTILTESRSRVPFPPMIEVLIMELVIEVLREAGVRMPTKIGQTIGIVGGIVIGTAAVEAGIASNILIVLVSVSALLSFVPSNYLMANAIRTLRYVFIFAAGTLGMYGQMLTLGLIYAHLAGLTSLGTPYLAPGIPRNMTDIFNGLIRAPVLFLASRTGLSRSPKKLQRPLDEE